MAVISNSVLNGLVSGITGNNNKAYILMHRPELNPANKNGDGSAGGTVSGLAGAAASLQSGVGSIAKQGRTLGIANSGVNALGVNNALTAAANSADYIPVQVQFNPSSISLQGMGGEIRRESVGGAGENQFQQFDTPSETVMSMELIFDDTNNKDAFMMDAELPLLSEITSVGGLTQRIEQAVTAGRGKVYSVQDTTELFVSAMVQNFTRLVGFAWNKMIFWGELVGVNVQYTMFNKTGAPIRAKVGIQIRQDQAIGSNDEYATEKEWEKAFEELFKANAGNNSFGIKNSNATNWLNGNFLNL